MPNDLPPLLAEPGMLRETFNPIDPFDLTTRDGMARRADSTGNVGTDSLRICILGEPASKANSRQFLMLGGRMRSVKSDKAIAYEKAAAPQVLTQCHRAGWKCRAVGRMRVTMTIYYATERPDLDESLILDVLQIAVYGNDRQVREKHVFHSIDKANPRTEILVEALN